MVEVRSAVLKYGRETVLEQLNMTVRRGDIYGLLGASGCGKTSLLSLLVGRRGPTAGTVSVLGSRPGDTLADLLFGFSYARMTKRLSRELREKGLTSSRA